MEEDYDLDEEGNWSYESYGSEVYEEDEIQQMGTSTAQQHQPAHNPLHLLSPYNIQLGGSENKVEEITETPPGFELTEENSVCKICYKNAINSVLCTT